MDEPVMEGYEFVGVESVLGLVNNVAVHKRFVGYWFNGVSERIWGVQTVWECMSPASRGLVNESADRRMIEEFDWQPRRATHVVLVDIDPVPTSGV